MANRVILYFTGYNNRLQGDKFYTPLAIIIDCK